MSRAMKPNSPPGQILCRIDAGVAHVTLSHPGRMNAMTVAMWRQLRGSSRPSGPTLRCAAWLSPAPKGISPPAPTSASFRPNAPTWPGCSAITARSWRRRWPRWPPARIPCWPVSRACAWAAAWKIAAQCDLRIAAESARFGVPIGKLGFPMAPDEMRGLLDLVGRAVTLAILLEGRVFDAAEALRLGLVTRTVPAAELDQAVQRSVAAILGGARRRRA